MRHQFLELDESLDLQSALHGSTDVVRIPARHWAPAIRLACGFRRFRRFRSEVIRHYHSPSLTFCGSGDFHHVTLALLAATDRPFNLLVLDNHPDWMRGLPFLHCGTWLHHAARLPNVQRIFHAGGDVDFDNHYRWLAPWSMLRSGKIVVLPAVRSFTLGNWSGVPNRPLRHNGRLDRAHLEAMLRPHRVELARFPLYISVDKDVLAAQDAVVNWDSGHLGLDELTIVLETFLDAAHGSLAGLDTVGDWSPVRVQGMFRKLLDKTEHPPLTIDPADAARRNQIVNRRLVDFVEEHVSARGDRCRELASGA
jgi:hypothetical protein